MVRFLSEPNLDAITYLLSRAASIDAMVNSRPMIVYVAYSIDWDVVWRLIELGARLDIPEVKAGLIEAFRVPGATLPDSPIYPYKVRFGIVSRSLAGIRHHRRDRLTGR
jgi:uncharacterized protein